MIMKRIFIVCIATLWLGSVVLPDTAMGSGDSSKEAAKKVSSKAKASGSTKSDRFIDRNKNGVNDRKARKVKRTRKEPSVRSTAASKPVKAAPKPKKTESEEVKEKTPPRNR
jgi:hypothetical protein